MLLILFPMFTSARILTTAIPYYRGGGVSIYNSLNTNFDLLLFRECFYEVLGGFRGKCLGDVWGGFWDMFAGFGWNVEGV